MRPIAPQIAQRVCFGKAYAGVSPKIFPATVFRFLVWNEDSQIWIPVSNPGFARGDFFYPGAIQMSSACQRVCFGVFATILNPRSIPSSKFRFRVSKCQISDLELELADLDSRCWEMVQTNAPTTNPFVFDRNTLFLTSLTCSPNTLIWCRNNSIRLLL